jgi:hypothetical protein
MMNDTCAYLVQLRGRIDEGDLSLLTSIEFTLVRVNPDMTHLITHTDQSGLIGLLRRLHGLGFTLLAVGRLDQESLPVTSLQARQD